MACDLNKSVLSDSQDTAVKRFAVVALADNIPTLTAWANDNPLRSGVFAAAQEFGPGGDVLIVISASGNSKNIVHAAEMAKKLGLTTIGLRVSKAARCVLRWTRLWWFTATTMDISKTPT